MKHLILLIFISLFISACSQTQKSEEAPEVNSNDASLNETTDSERSNEIFQIADKGINQHELGEYQQAVETYLNGLKKYPASGILHYQIAYAYFELNQFEKVIYHTDIVIDKQDNEALLNAYSLQASVLDVMGNMQESIDTFERAIKHFPNNYLLRFNYGLTLFKVGNVDAAENNFKEAIELNPGHPGSHSLLAYSQGLKKNRIESILGFYFFLMLEPNTERARETMDSLLELSQQSMVVTADEDMKIIIDGNMGGTPLSELSLTVSFAAKENRELPEQSKYEHLFRLTRHLLSSVKEPEESYDNFWINNYVSFLAKVINAGHKDAFIHHMLQSKGNKSARWIKNNQQSYAALMEWFNS